MTNYSKHLTPDDWSDPKEREFTTRQTLKGLLILSSPFLIFFSGMIAEWWLKWGL